MFFLKNCFLINFIFQSQFFYYVNYNDVYIRRTTNHGFIVSYKLQTILIIAQGLQNIRRNMLQVN